MIDMIDMGGSEDDRNDWDFDEYEDRFFEDLKTMSFEKKKQIYEDIKDELIELRNLGKPVEWVHRLKKRSAVFELNYKAAKIVKSLKNDQEYMELVIDA